MCSRLLVLLTLLAGCRTRVLDSPLDSTPPDLSVTPLDLSVTSADSSAAPVDLSPPVDLAVIPWCIPMGTHKAQFVINTVTLPKTFNEFGVDLDGDHTPNNALGRAIAAFATLGLDSQKSSDRALAAGQTTLIDETSVDPAFRTDHCASINFYRGNNHPGPPGLGPFQIDPSIPPDHYVGMIVQGLQSTAQPDFGDDKMHTLRLSLFGGVLVRLPLDGVGVSFDHAGGALVNGEIYGSVQETVIQSEWIPSMAASFDARQKADPNGTTSTQLRALFDVGDGQGKSCTNADGSTGVAHDGTISACEVAHNSLVQSALAPDVKILKNGVWSPNPTDPAKDSLSVVIKFTAVPANF